MGATWRFIENEIVPQDRQGGNVKDVEGPITVPSDLCREERHKCFHQLLSRTFPHTLPPPAPASAPLACLLYMDEKRVPHGKSPGDKRKVYAKKDAFRQG